MTVCRVKMVELALLMETCMFVNAEKDMMDRIVNSEWENEYFCLKKNPK